MRRLILQIMADIMAAHVVAADRCSPDRRITCFLFLFVLTVCQSYTTYSRQELLGIGVACERSIIAEFHPLKTYQRIS